MCIRDRYYVDIAVNGVDGLKKFDETYSLVIMDIIMPVSYTHLCRARMR